MSQVRLFLCQFQIQHIQLLVTRKRKKPTWTPHQRTQCGHERDKSTWSLKKFSNWDSPRVFRKSKEITALWPSFEELFSASIVVRCCFAISCSVNANRNEEKVEQMQPSIRGCQPAVILRGIMPTPKNITAASVIGLDRNCRSKREHPGWKGICRC